MMQTNFMSRVLDRQRAIDRLVAEQAAELIYWKRSNTWSHDGSKSAAHHFSRQTGCSVSKARKLFTRSEKLSTMPATLSAYFNGDISTCRADLMISANANKLEELFQASEQELLDNVKILPFHQAQQFVDYWVEEAKESLREEGKVDDVDNRHASVLRSFDNGVDVTAWLDAIGGEIFATEFERQVQILWKQDEANPLSTRTVDQRRADALVEMARRSANFTTGGSSKALITVVMGIDSLKRSCELASGRVVTPGQVAPLLSEALIERIMFDNPSSIIDVSEKRLFVGAVRRAIEVRDKFCQDPSVCDLPAAKCQIDHISGLDQRRQNRNHQRPMPLPIPQRPKRHRPAVVLRRLRRSDITVQCTTQAGG